MFTTDEASPQLLRRLRGLLEDAFGGGFTHDDWDHTLGGWHAVVEQGELPVAHAAVVERVLEIGTARIRAGYVEGVATAPGMRGRGLATVAMRCIDGVIRERFDIGALSTGIHGLYTRLGWERWRGPTFVRRAGRLVRTADEDDGVMVLRFGPSAMFDTTERIVCHARAGDDW